MTPLVFGAPDFRNGKRRHDHPAEARHQLGYAVHAKRTAATVLRASPSMNTASTEATTEVLTPNAANARRAGSRPYGESTPPIAPKRKPGPACAGPGP
jgi:hypothetical protein